MFLFSFSSNLRGRACSISCMAQAVLPPLPGWHVPLLLVVTSHTRMYTRILTRSSTCSTSNGAHAHTHAPPQCVTTPAQYTPPHTHTPHHTRTQTTTWQVNSRPRMFLCPHSAGVNPNRDAKRGVVGVVCGAREEGGITKKKKRKTDRKNEENWASACAKVSAASQRHAFWQS